MRGFPVTGKLELTANGETSGVVPDKMLTDGPPVVRNSVPVMPDRPGIGVSPDESFLRSHLPKDEPWWD